MTGKAIYDILSDTAGVTALVSTRIYPDIATQGAVYPFVVYSVEGTLPTDTKDGPSGLDVVQVAVMIYANTYTAAQDIAGAVRTALDRTAGTFASVVVQSIKFDGQSSASMNLDKQVYIVEQTYSVREVR
jgi:hypothetical protein